MQLCLVNNDPVSTILESAEGIPLYSINTPNPDDPSVELPYKTQDSQTLSHTRSPTTTITRLNRHYQCTGNVETVIGFVEYHGSTSGTNVRLFKDDLDVHIAPYHTFPEQRCVSRQLDGMAVSPSHG